MYDLLQLLGGIILGVGYIPQITKMIRTKSAEDFSLKTYFLLLLGIGCMEVYAIRLTFTGSGEMFLVTNTLSLLITGIMCAYRLVSALFQG